MNIFYIRLHVVSSGKLGLINQNKTGSSIEVNNFNKHPSFFMLFMYRLSTILYNENSNVLVLSDGFFIVKRFLSGRLI